MRLLRKRLESSVAPSTLALTGFILGLVAVFYAVALLYHLQLAVVKQALCFVNFVLYALFAAISTTGAIALAQQIFRTREHSYHTIAGFVILSTTAISFLLLATTLIP